MGQPQVKHLSLIFSYFNYYSQNLIIEFGIYIILRLTFLLTALSMEPLEKSQLLPFSSSDF